MNIQNCGIIFILSENATVSQCPYKFNERQMTKELDNSQRIKFPFGFNILFTVGGGAVLNCSCI